MSFVGCLDACEASYTCRECRIKSVVVDREGEVCTQCGLRQSSQRFDFNPYAMKTEEGDLTLQHEDQRAQVLLVLSCLLFDFLHRWTST